MLHDDITRDRPCPDAAVERVARPSAATPTKHPVWREENCPEITLLTKIGDEIYFKGADGKLLPTRKDQPPPDLRYFKQTQR